MKKVTVKIDKKGKSTIEVSGSPGSSCLVVINKITEALGAKVADEKKTPEFYAQETNANSIYDGKP
jgi:hypothetical protein